MGCDNEEKQDVCQKPDNPLTDKDKSAPTVEANTPTNLPQPTENKHELGSGFHNTGDSLSSSLSSAQQQTHNTIQLVGKDNMVTKREKGRGGQAEPKAAATSFSGLKKNGDQGQDARRPERTLTTYIHRKTNGGLGITRIPPALPALPPTSFDRHPAQLRSNRRVYVKRPVEDIRDDSDDEEDSWQSCSDSSCDEGSGAAQKKAAADRASSWAESVVSDMAPEDMDDDSPSRLEWLRQKREDNERNRFLDKLMTMVGLEEVKAHFLAVKARVKAMVQAIRDDSAEEPELRLHLVLQGKDGTGKKSIAKLYAQFLYSIGAVEDKVAVRVSNLQSLKPGNTGLPYESARLGAFTEYGTASAPAPPNSKHPTVVFYDKSESMNQYNGLYGYPDKDFGMDDFLGLVPRRGKMQAERDEAARNQEMDKLMEVAEKSSMIVSSQKKSLLELIDSSERALLEFPTPLILSDYNDDELRRILVRMIQKKDLSVEGGFEARSLDLLVQRVARERKSPSFSNVHRLQKELDKACRRRALRMQREYSQWSGRNSGAGSKALCLLDPMDQLHDDEVAPKTSIAVNMVNERKKIPLTSEDIIGPQPKDVRHENASWGKLQNMVGLERVKAECGDIIDYAQINHRRQLLGMEPLKIGLNRLFLGPPGVGKTTVAQLYGQILIDLGLVSGDKVLLRNPSHLIGPYVGQSERKTKKVLDDAQGNVLIIDDAHMLYPGSAGASNKTDVFRVAVLDTIVANVSADPDDRCILLLGYEHEMGQLFNNSNQGLQRRFPKETALRFETYSVDELCQIMDLKAAGCGLEMTAEARAVSREVLGRMRINPKFGNAGDVENLLNQAKVRANARISLAARGEGLVQVVLGPGDIDPQWDRFLRADENRIALFDGFVGFKKIVKKFEGYKFLVDGMRLHGVDPKPHIPWAFVFKGPPGTGKTSTARKVGSLYYDMGLLSTDEVVTCSVSDLIGEAQGQTGPKVLNTLEAGLGKVLFIDEAYRLAGGTIYQIEAIGELVDAMTQPRYNKNMVVILAGYTAEMEFLLRTNPGLRSRFPEQVVFPPMTPHACFKHLRHEVRKLNIYVPDPKEADVEDIRMVNGLFETLSHTTGWASGRDIETLAKTIIGKVYMREGRARNEGVVGRLYFDIDEVIEVLEAMWQERREGEDSETDE